jgi:hypothetical protein
MAKAKAALIITFARPDGVQRLLKAGIDAGVETFFVAIDGPRTAEHSLLQNRIINIVEDFKITHGTEIKVWQRSENLGVAVSILTAIGWFFSQVDEGVILEDDLAPSEDFFTFSFAALESYRSIKDVWLISGSRMKEETLGSTINDWSNYPMIWGWATWSNRWLEIYTGLLEQNRPSILRFFDKRSNYWYIGSERAKRGQIDTWDLPFVNAQLRSKKFSIIPPVNLVTNLGFDEHAAHTTGNSYPLNHPTSPLPVDWALSSSPDHLNARAYDEFLDRELYKMRWFHKFLRIYAPFFTAFRMAKLNTRASLPMRLSKVKIPKL